ncbi:sodium-dependent neutral amino acid transporter B(0)AT3 isoform X3 [Octopus bimaculoides]|uniref:Transporter n=3 Tax=Octopus bimaculoides TaxID=37653 RepID=A0A0L8HB76_OCTBM|nr:sodium-dependent neutral amino acid transporter B(0)AT3 isoform X3 [Octopus bimaculoides]|eukprot:XP_014773793.1 PREDICTED: sodium-dependent neutral amino acid transporter B(0)AT3-like isoform X3 [Octopus bimaculoides]
MDTNKLPPKLQRSNSYLVSISDNEDGLSQISGSPRQLSISTIDGIGKKHQSTNGTCPSVASDTTNKSTEVLMEALRMEEEQNAPTKSRGAWDSKFQYMLAVIGYAVGLGNVWRFPYLVQKNGGGAFLIPYTLMLAIEGIPIFFLELALGQRMRKGAIGAWNQISPFMGGIGICCAIVSFIVGLYYNTIIAWCLYYLVLSFRSNLPWEKCPTVQVGKYKNESRLVEECRRSGPTAYFWYRETLNISDSVDKSGVMSWWILVCLVFAWLLVFICIVKGIKSSGKVVYVTAIFPYIVLIIFFFRGVTLPGFQNGLYHLFVPEFSRLSDPQVWVDAASQIFYSLGLGFGSLIALSSYNPTRNNCHRDAIFIALTNCCTSVFAGIVVFSILGFKATKRLELCQEIRDHELMALFNDTNVIPPPAGTLVNISSSPNGEVTSVVMPNITTCSFKEEILKSASGTGLTFIAFTEAINQFSVPPIWSILFFLMLLTIGLDSMFATLEGVVTPILDLDIIPDLRKYPPMLSACLCLSSFLLSFVFANQAGPYIFVLFDEYVSGLPLLIIVFAEIITISYIYGLYRFSNDIELMTGHRPNYYLMFCWKFICPAIIIFLIVILIINLTTDEKEYDVWHRETGSLSKSIWPGWCLFVAALIIILSILGIPLIALIRWLKPSSWREEVPAYFPRELIQLERKLTTYIPKEWEKKILFRFEKHLPTTESEFTNKNKSQMDLVFI